MPRGRPGRAAASASACAAAAEAPNSLARWAAVAVAAGEKPPALTTARLDLAQAAWAAWAAAVPASSLWESPAAGPAAAGEAAAGGGG